MTFPTGRITGLQSADCIEMIEIHDGGGEIETRVRESCCTVAHVYSSYESDAARLRSAPYTAVLIRMGPIAQGGGRERTQIISKAEASGRKEAKGGREGTKSESCASRDV